MFNMNSTNSRKSQNEIANSPTTEKTRHTLLIRVEWLEVFCDETGDYVRVASTEACDGDGILIPVKDIVEINPHLRGAAR